MKVRNILIGLLVVLMAFVFISCEDEPEEIAPQPGPVDNSIYKLTATKGLSDGFYKYDKFVLDFPDGIGAEETVSFLFRSSRDVYQVSIRSIDGSTKYVYEVAVDKEDKPYTLEDMGNGWTKLSYTFAADAENFRVDLRVRTIVGDFVEIKNVFVGGESIALSEENVDLETYGSVLPTFAKIDDHDWLTDSTYTVAYFTAKPHYEDDFPVMEAVTKGGKITKAGLSKDNYFIEKIQLITDFHETGDMTLADFDPATATIESDVNLLVTWKGVARTVTFNSNGGSDVPAQSIPHNSVATKPENPTNGVKLFAEWYTSATEFTAETLFDFSTPITSDITLYARWADDVKTVTIDKNTGNPTNDVEVRNVVINETTTAPVLNSRPGFFFEGWFVGDTDTPFDFSAPVTANVSVKARWSDGTVYQIVATAGNGTDSYDKFILDWQASELRVNKDDVLTFKYRATVDFEEYSIRDDETTVTDDVGGRWIYQQSASAAAANGLIITPLADGWVSVEYTFAEKYTAKGSSAAGIAAGDVVEYPNVFRFDLRSHDIRPGDILEVSGIAINGVEKDLYAVDNCATAFIDDEDPLFEDYPWNTSVTVSFDYGDKTVDSDIEWGSRVALPTDVADYVPGQMFVGWYKDDLYSEAFNSALSIQNDITLYGKWVETVAVTLNNIDGSTDRIDLVAKDSPMAKPRGVGRAGYFLEGWYTTDPNDPGFDPVADAWDFDDPVPAAMELFAKWKAPTEEYQLTATKEHGRFQLRYKESARPVLDGMKPGDVITFQVKFAAASVTPASFRVRTYQGESNITSDPQALPELADGWYSISVTVPDSITNGQGLYIAFFANANWAIGDVCVFRALALNGVEVTMSSSNSNGPYGGVEPSFVKTVY